jgi:hypothetical protein
VKADRDAALRLDAVELRQEVDVEVGAAKLAVGDPAQPEVLLELDDAANRVILGGPQLRGVDRTRLELVARVEQELGAQETPDVVGAIRRRGARADGRGNGRRSHPVDPRT